MLSFEWDTKKAKSNKHKHNITFDEASTVFADILSLIIADPLRSEYEERFVITGSSHKNRMITGCLYRTW